LEDYIIVLNEGGSLSPKMNFILSLVDRKSHKLFVATRTSTIKCKESWVGNRVELGTSVRGILVYFSLMALKSPKDLRDGMIRRISRKKGQQKLFTGGLLSSLSLTLQNSFGTPARSNNLVNALKRVEGKKIFLIDEFSSINIAKLEKIRKIGKVVYVSQDIAHNRYDYENLISKNLIRRLEKKIVMQCDLVIACSARDKLAYKEMGAKRVLYYPNIYPIAHFKPLEKDETPSICVVLREYWGERLDGLLQEIITGLSLVNTKLAVTFIGKKPDYTPKNVDMIYHKLIASKLHFLETVSKSWICINVGIHLGGSNERKYDFSMAGSVVVSDRLGVRGDLLPCEYVYVDSHDLAAKLNELIKLGKDRLAEMGLENRKRALELADTQKASVGSALAG
jgi:hypothetical protein